MNYLNNLDAPLLRLSGADDFTLRDAVQGVQVFGGIGSGKTSGSGKTLASAYLRAGMGGLVLAAKPDEVESWLRLTKANGRENSVIVFGERRGACNFIDYELARQGPAGVGGVVEYVMRALEAVKLTSSSPGHGGHEFFDDAKRQTLRNTIPVLHAALGRVTVPDIVRFISSAPTSLEQLHSEEWQRHSFMFKMLLKATKQPLIPMSADDFQKTASYWRDEFAQLDAKTRSNIAITVSTALDRFNRGRLQQAFCSGTSLVPELTFHGAIIIMDMPALTWNEDGIIGQHLFKYMWQRAVLSRNALDPQHRDRPVFLWADESQYFVNSYDAEFQSACRSSRACTVFLTQSLPTYYARIGGENPQHRADMLLANFATKIFHSNSCPVTNQFASSTIGRSLQIRRSQGTQTSFGTNRGMGTSDGSNWGRSSGSGFSTDGKGNVTYSSNSGNSSGGNAGWNRQRGSTWSEGENEGFSEAMDNEIEPGDFGRVLKTGGPANGGEVSGVWFQSGKRFRASDRNYLAVSFRQ